MLSRDAIRVAVLIALVSLASYLCGLHFTRMFHGASAGIGALWAVISGVGVFQGTRRKTWLVAWPTVLGTLVGATLGAAYLSFLPFSAVAMAASILVAGLLCHAARAPELVRPAAITVAVIMVVSSLDPNLCPLLSAVLRFTESCIGTALAIVGALVWPEAAGPTPRQTGVAAPGADARPAAPER